MRAAVPLSLALIAIAATDISAARVRLVNRTELEAAVRERREGRVLLVTDGPEGPGMAWVPSRMIEDSDAPHTPTVEQRLAEAEALLEQGQSLQAATLLESMLRSFPNHRRVRLLLARGLRRQGTLEPAHFLLGTLVAEAQASVEELMEAAEVAVLMSDTQAGDRLLRRLHKALADDDQRRAYLEELGQQLRGGTRVCFAGPPPPHLDRNALRSRRAAFDARKGDSLYSQELSDRLLAFANSVGRDTGQDVVDEVFVRAVVPAVVRERYLSGQAHGEFSRSARSVEAWVFVEERIWLAHFDWKKRMLLSGLAFATREGYPQAVVEVRVVARDPADASRRKLKDLAKATLGRADEPELSLYTSPQRDVPRAKRIRSDIERRKQEQKKR